MNRQSTIRRATALVLMLMACIASADVQQRSKEIIHNHCKSCHGEDGIAKVESWPNLACQNRGYLSSRMMHLQLNDEHSVDDTIKDLSFSEIDYIAHYYAEQPCKNNR